MSWEMADGWNVVAKDKCLSQMQKEKGSFGSFYLSIDDDDLSLLDDNLKNMTEEEHQNIRSYPFCNTEIVLNIKSEGLYLKYVFLCSNNDGQNANIRMYDDKGGQIGMLVTGDEGVYACVAPSSSNGKEMNYALTEKGDLEMKTFMTKNLDFALIMINTKLWAIETIRIAPQKMSRRQRKGIDPSKVRRIIHLVSENKKIVYKTKGTIEYLHKFSVRGHWRKITSLGKNRSGDYVIDGKTWVSAHIKGEGDFIKKTRAINYVKSGGINETN